MGRKELGKWLEGRDWTYWESLTFMYDATPRAARRAVERYLKAWPVDRAVWVIEHGRVGGHTHAHALTYYGNRVPDPSDLWHWWHSRYGRATIHRHDWERGATNYLLKSMGGAREDHMRRGVDWEIYTRQPFKPNDQLPWKN